MDQSTYVRRGNITLAQSTEETNKRIHHTIIFSSFARSYDFLRKGHSNSGK